MQSKVPTDLKACMASDEKFVEEVKLAGIRMYRVTGEDPQKISSRTIWLEGGCVEVESVHQWREVSVKLGGVTTVKLDYLSLNEPPASLFEIASDFHEESQTEASMREYKDDMSKAPKCLLDSFNRKDELKRYRRLGPGPGGKAEAFVKQHGRKGPDPNIESMKIRLEDAK